MTAGRCARTGPCWRRLSARSRTVRSDTMRNAGNLSRRTRASHFRSGTASRSCSATRRGIWMNRISRKASCGVRPGSLQVQKSAGGRTARTSVVAQPAPNAPSGNSAAFVGNGVGLPVPDCRQQSRVFRGQGRSKFRERRGAVQMPAVAHGDAEAGTNRLAMDSAPGSFPDSARAPSLTAVSCRLLDLGCGADAARLQCGRLGYGEDRLLRDPSGTRSADGRRKIREPPRPAAVRRRRRA